MSAGVRVVMAAEAAEDVRERCVERALRALRISGRRLVRLRGSGEGWGVLAKGDRRRRAQVRLEQVEVDALAAEGLIVAAGEDAYVLAVRFAGDAVAAPKLAPWVFAAVGVRRSTRRGVGFMALAHKAREGLGPLNLRGAEAGLRVIRDAELQANDSRLTMDWDAGPADRNRRSGVEGGRRGAARDATRRLRRLEAVIGEDAFAMAWALCVEGAAIGALQRRFGLKRRVLFIRLAETLEAVADAYDGVR